MSQVMKIDNDKTSLLNSAEEPYNQAIEIYDTHFAGDIWNRKPEM